MKSKINFKTKLYCAVLSVAIFCLAVTGLLFFRKPEAQAYAAFVSASPVTISNSNFNNSPSSSYPFQPSGYSHKDVDDAGVEAGVINLTNEKYKDLYKKNSEDDYVLMIKSKNHGSDFSYTTSSAISMDANSHYMVTVDVYTNNNNGAGNLYLKESRDDNTSFASLTRISSPNDWTTYQFFVSTNDVESLDLYLELNMHALSDEDVVLFDNLSCFKLNEDDLNTRMNNMSAKLMSYSDKRNDNFIDKVDLSENGAFTANNIGTGCVTGFTSDINQLDGSADGAFVIENTKKTQSKFETKDNFLTVNQNEIIKVSLNVKVEDLSGNVNLQLIQTNLDKDEDAVNSEQIKITSNTGVAGNLTNNYATYSFYVFGYPDKSVTYKLALGVGDDSTETSAKVYVTTATFTRVNSSTFNAVSNGSYAQKLNLNSQNTSTDSNFLTNGKLNTISISDYNAPYPATAESWEVVTGSGIQKYGIVNTADSEWDKLKTQGLSNLLNPYSTYGSSVGDNVLIMYNAGADTLSYTTASKSLNAKAYYKFSVDVQTQFSRAGETLTLQLVTTKDNSEVVLCSTEVETNARDWQTAELYVHTGFQKMDVKLKVTLNSKACAYAYLDNAKCLTLSSLTESEFNEILGGAYVVKADLTDMFVMGDNKNPSLFTTTGEIGEHRIVDLNGSVDDVTIENYRQQLTSLNSTNKNVILLRAMEDSNFTLTSKIGFDLESDKYYRISVYAFTRDLQSLNGSNDNRGASIKLTSFDDSFTRVESEGKWTKYSFYINPNSATTTYLQLAIGNGETACAGDVFFGGIEFKDDLTQEEFEKVSANKFNLVLKETNETNNDEETEDNENNNNNGNNSALWYAIPTILTALAIVIAIVGVVARKVKWKKPRKKAKTTYDRNATVSKQIYERKATTLREEKLRELKNELDKKSGERTAFEEQYKKDLSTMRQLKIKRADQSEINKLNKDMKKNQKLSANLGLEITRLESDIELMKTDAYFNSLVKKLMREDEANRRQQIDEEEQTEKDNAKSSSNKNKKGN